jgi:predicted transcriptional regulator
MRAFSGADDKHAAIREKKGKGRKKQANRRSKKEIAELGERFYEVLCDNPGETMAMLASLTGSTSAELSLPVSKLKQAKRIKSTGERAETRYYPVPYEVQDSEVAQ